MRDKKFRKSIAISSFAVLCFTGFVNSSRLYATTVETPIIKTVKTGSNNTLNEDKMKYYQKKIGDDYKFISNKGKSGSFATAYKLEDKSGNEFVLKISNRPENSENWVQQQKEAYKKIKKYYKDYHGELKITNYVKFGDDFVIEEYLGEMVDFSKDYIKSNIESFVNGMAEFLNYTHKYEKSLVAPTKFILLKESFDYLNEAGALNDEDKEMLSKLINKFESRDISDEVTALIHTDIRFQNIVYNPKTQKFALIDFDSLSTDFNIYYSFTSRTIGSCGIPYEFISKIVDKYDEKSNLKVNKEKIKMMHQLGTMQEQCMCAKYRNHISNECIKDELWPKLKIIFKNIDKAFEN